MTNYFMLECFSPNSGKSRSILEYPTINGIDSWLLGAKFPISPPDPITLEWDPLSEGVKKKFYDLTIPLMHKELIFCLESSGVDNIDSYPVKIIDTNTGEIDFDYLAVNVIGVVAVADMSRSEYTDHSGRGLIDLDIDKLVLSELKIYGFSLFRLAECVSGLMVSDRLKNSLEKHNDFGLSFLLPKDWIG